MAGGYRHVPCPEKGTSYSGIPDFRSQDNMSTETAGPIYDRTREHLSSTDADPVVQEALETHQE